MSRRRSKRRRGHLWILLGLLASAGVLFAHLAVHLSPAHWAFPALAGLGFPVFGLLLFVSMWVALRRGRWFWFLGFLLLVVCSAPLYRCAWGGFGFGMPEVHSGGLTFKVMSWNVRLYDRYGWLGEGTREGIFESVEAEAPDLLCLQEHFRDSDPVAFPVDVPMRRAFTGETGVDVERHEVWARGKSGRRFGVVTWSRYPIVGKEAIVFGTTSNNVCGVTDIKWKGDTVRVFNAHFASLHFGSEEYAALEYGVPDAESRQRIWSRMRTAYTDRVTQVGQVMTAVSRSPHPVVLCGDFNDVPVSWALASARAQLRDVHDVQSICLDGTWQGVVPGLRIDHLFIDPSWAVVNYETGGGGLSDHRYVTSEVQVPSR
ncbi:MAG: hypothetical protein CL849_00195 [Crocinitomicaceae bacterium]|nr:hypothetical protein [Crocinitomicaceae bacterium]